MLTLAYESERTTRPNVFRAEAMLGLWRVYARVRTTPGAPIFEVDFWAQVQAREMHRRHDDEGHPVLLLSRAGTGDREYSLESCKLHHSLPRSAYLLRGFDFGS